MEPMSITRIVEEYLPYINVPIVICIWYVTETIKKIFRSYRIDKKRPLAEWEDNILCYVTPIILGMVFNLSLGLSVLGFKAFLNCLGTGFLTGCVAGFTYRPLVKKRLKSKGD